MNGEEYISSGVLELYVMGALPEAEMQQVREMARRFPEVTQEIEKIEALMESYALLNAAEPRIELKEKVMNRIKQETLRVIKTESRDENVAIKKLNANESSRNFYAYLAAASLALLIVSSAFNLFVWKKLKESGEQLAVIRSEKQEYGNQLATVKSSYDQTLAEINILQNKDYKAIEMKGLPVAPHALVRVYWNQQTKETFVNIADLPAPPAGKQYQLWALVDGKPIDAGIFEGKASMQKVKSVENAQAFAVTLEPEGGSAVPTLTAMYVMGNV